MTARTWWWIAGAGGLVLTVAAVLLISDSFGFGQYDQYDAEVIEGEESDMTPGQRLCASQTTVDSIKVRIFNRAREATEEDAAALTRLENETVARMEEPRLLEFDEDLDQALCDGRLVLELPRGTEPAFNNQRRLRADIEYTAQPSADGDGTAFRLSGADSLINRLSNANLGPRRRSEPEDEQEFEPKPIEEQEPELEAPDGDIIGPEEEFEDDDYDRTGLPPPIEDDRSVADDELPDSIAEE